MALKHMGKKISFANEGLFVLNFLLSDWLRSELPQSGKSVEKSDSLISRELCNVEM